MKQLTIVVKPFRAEAVLRVIAELGVTACAVREAKGYGRQKGYLDRYRGSEYSTAYLPKVEITVWVTDEQAAELGETVPKVARTGPHRRRQGVRRPARVAGAAGVLK